MPIGDETRLRHRRDGGNRGFVLGAVALAALTLGLAGCKPPNTVAKPADAAVSVKPATAVTPIATEKLSAPVALAPGFTGGAKASPPAHAGSAKSASTMPAPAPRAKASARATSAAAIAPAPSPPKVPPAAVVNTTAAVTQSGRPPPTGVLCPAGTVGMWTRDVIDADVYICRPLHPQ